MSRNLQLVIVGVGGQGILTVSDILGTAAIEEGLKAVMSEVHGMAQRGGVVTTEMKIGDFESPLVAKGEADVILGFEPVETYRTLEKASPRTGIVTNTDPLVPPGVSLGQGAYPKVEKLIENMRNGGLKVIAVPALEIARSAGSTVAGNIVMLGAMVALENFVLAREAVEAALRKRIAPRWLDLNLKAFQMGYEAGKKQ
ncbi:MAG: indolepyruvate oxidoreductase subunit beta [Candidatus Eremiobacteraeota bacterium]|nr:indolepyruvate oxidoreductase subunit beta [Candidatus Eremiobacteraeota bacterium]